MECLYLILMVVVIQETSELNPDILKYDEWIKDAEIRVKKIKADEKRHVEYEKDTGSSIPNKRETDNAYPDSGYNIKWIEKQFLAHLIPGLTYHSSKLAQWSRDKQEALCLRAMNNTFQFHGGKTTTTATKTLKFRWERHEPIKVDVIVCPAPNRCIYENRRYRDCYVVLARDEYKNDSPDELYILYERCELGLE